MQEFVYNMFRLIFGPGLIEDTANFVGTAVEALNKLFPDGGSDVMNTSMDMFATLAAALLIIFYFIDLGSKASRETLTLQTLTLSFIRLMIAFTLVVYSKEITINLCNLSSNIFYMVAEQTTGTKTDKKKITGATTDKEKNTDYGITFWGMKTLPKYEDKVKGGINVKYSIEKHTNPAAGEIYGDKVVKETKSANLEDMQAVFEDKNAGLFPTSTFKVKGFLKIFPYVLYFLLPWLISLIALGASFLFAITNTLNIVVYAFFMPIAVTQVFDDVQRSNAIRYIKKFFALTLNYAGILVILFALSKIQSSIMPTILSGLKEINSDNFSEILNFKLLISVSVVQFSAVGAIAGVNKFTSDLMGVG